MPCLVCGNEADYLCDNFIGGPIGGYRRVGVISENTFQAHYDVEEVFTCDAELCNSCRISQGNRFFCGSKEITHVESHDYCPANHPKPKPMTESEAKGVRRQIHAQLKRMKMRRPNSTTPNQLNKKTKDYSE